MQVEDPVVFNHAVVISFFGNNVPSVLFYLVCKDVLLCKFKLYGVMLVDDVALALYQFRWLIFGMRLYDCRCMRLLHSCRDVSG